MSIGRHAAKRAAQANEKLANDQQVLLDKEEKTKGIREKDIESQRIAITRARFGGQSPDATGPQETQDPVGGLSGGGGVQSKNSVPNTLRTRDPVKNTLMSMYLDSNQPNQQDNFISG
jgi:hypothetical protein